MLIIKLQPQAGLVDPGEDDLGRDRFGYSPTMGAYALWDAARGTWHTKASKAAKERYALVAAGGIVRQVVELNGAEEVPHKGGGMRTLLHGQPVLSGSIVDKYVGKPLPFAVQSQNPINYWPDAPEDKLTCACGCGEPSKGTNPFVVGHDHTALHDRIRQIGTVKEFIDWFDAMRAPFPAAT